MVDRQGLGIQALGGGGDGKSIGRESPTALRRSCAQMKTRSLNSDAGGGKTDGLKSLSTKKRREPKNKEYTGINLILTSDFELCVCSMITAERSLGFESFSAGFTCLAYFVFFAVLFRT